MQLIKATWLSTMLKHTIAIALLFLAFIYFFHNNNTLILQMSTESKTSLQAEIYYTREGEAFNASKSFSTKKRNGILYYFTLPKFSQFNYVRLDPSKSKQKIKIFNNILIEKSLWFKTYVYKADITKSKPSHQIKDYTINKKGISFSTIGNDPQLNINLTHALIYKKTDYHLYTLFLVILLYLIFLFLLKLNKETTVNNYLIAKLILYTMIFSLAFFKVNYYKEHVRFIYTPDMVGHFSYIKDMHDSPTLLPHFESMYMITNKAAGNHLGHPPLYYLLMGLAYDENATSAQNAETLRSLNIMLFMASLLLLLYLGFQSSMPIIGHFTYLSILTAIPMHAYLGAAITNDNLAFFGAVLFLIGIKRFLDKDESIHTYFIVLIGIFIAFFSKFTAALLIAFSLIYLLIYFVIIKRSPVISLSRIFLVLLFSVPIVFYQLHIFIDYHAIVPTLNITHPEEYLTSVYYIPEIQREYKTFLEWISLYGHAIHTGWFGIHSHHSFFKHEVSEYFALLVFHIMALITLILPCSKKDTSLCILGKLTLLSLLTVALIQLLFGYKTHLFSGYTGGLQPRYLLPFMVGFAIMASIFINRFSKYLLFNIAIIILCIHAIYSDFFYFLQYYQ